MRLSSLLVLVVSSTSLAQYAGAFGTSWGSSSMAWASTMSSRWVADNTRLEKMTSALARSKHVRVDFTRTSFTPVGPRLVVEPLAAKAGTAEQRKTLRELFTASLAGFEAQGHPNNVAWAMTFMVVASTAALTGRELPDADVEAMAAAINGELVASPEFQKLSAKDKQTLYETCVVTGGTIVAFMQRDSAELTAAAKDIARAALRLN